MSKTSKKGAVGVDAVKSSVLKFLKNPYNLAFSIFFLFVFWMYVSHAFIDSIWLDEVKYMAEGIQAKHNPLDVLHNDNYTQFVVLVIAFFNIFFVLFDAGRVAGLAFAFVGIICTYLLGKEVKDRFTGLVAASLLAFEWWYYFLSLKGLTDVPMTSMLIAYSYVLFITLKNPTRWKIILTVFVGVCGFFTKGTGIFLLPFTVIVLLVYYSTKKNLLLAKKYATHPRSLIALGAAALFGLYLLFFTQLISPWLSNISRFDMGSFVGNVKAQTTGLMSMTSIILLVLGTILLLLYRKRETIIISSGLIFLLSGSILSAGNIKELRLFLPILPSLYLVIGYFLSELVLYGKVFLKFNKYVLQIVVALLVIFIILVPNYATGNNLVMQRSFSYSGYQEAMQWAEVNIPPDGDDLYISNFFACCNYNVGLRSRTDTRRTNSSAMFRTFEEFESFVLLNNQSTLYLMPDFWETGQPQWVNLRTLLTDQSKMQQLTNLGFQPVYQVLRPVPTQQGLQEIPVIIVFKKN